MKIKLYLYLITTLNFSFIVINQSCSQSENWTQFRGSRLDGISHEKNLPVFWNDSTNIMWKTTLPGTGLSSPVVFANQIWLTTSMNEGKELYGICVDINSGRQIYKVKLFNPDSVFPIHPFNSYATPTPCIEQGFVYLHFGTYGTACVNTRDGSILWKRNDLHCAHILGPGSSPIIYKNLLILHLEGTDVQFIVALNKQTGEIVWKKTRPLECYTNLEIIGKKAYITPIIITVNGQDQLISNGSAVCIAYNPETGEEIWRIVEGEDSTVAMPFSEHSLVYYYTSFITPKEGDKYAELLAVNPHGFGNIKETNVIWKLKSPVFQLLTPVIKDGLIYTVDARNNLFCLDAKTGEKTWTVKLKNKYNSSPIYADGHIYLTSVNGETIVLKHGTSPDICNTNKLNGDVYATIAISQNSIIMRTSKYLYRIGNR